MTDPLNKLLEESLGANALRQVDEAVTAKEPILVVEAKGGMAEKPLYNRKAPHYYVQQEKPHHRYMLELAAQGFTVKEIAEQTGFTPVAVNNIIRQPHAQETLVQSIAKHAKRDEEVLELVTQNVTKAVKVLASIMNDEECSPQARISAARELLDRKYGKPNQPVTHNEGVDLSKLSDAELAAMLPKTQSTGTS